MTAEKVLGSIEPRIFTPPLRMLTRQTTLGYAALDFWRDELHWTPLPHQRWLILHLEELLEDGSPRFRSALITQARRNGKTEFATAYALWTLSRQRSTLFSSASLPTARQTWQKIKDGAFDMGWDFKERGANSQEEVRVGRSHFQVVSNNRNSARGRDGHVIMIDELRAHENDEALAALVPCANNYDDAKILYFSNAGDRRAVPLQRIRAAGIDGAEPTLFIAEWSARDDCELDSLEDWKLSNPALGRTIQPSVIRAAMGTKPAGMFRIEELNQNVTDLKAAVTLEAWEACTDPGSLAGYRDKVCLGFDIAADGHSTLVAAAALPDGRIRVETVATWSSLQAARAGLSAEVARVKPRGISWFPGGAVNAMSGSLRELRNQHDLTGQDATGACMALADLVNAGRLAHQPDETLGSHITTAAKQRVSDAWRFNRDDTETVDAAYAMAGAVHLAMNLPEQDIGLFVLGS